MLERIAGNGVRTILVESPDRFAPDLAVQLAGHDFLKSIDVTLIPASAPDFFVEDTPTAVLVRQVLGAIAQFEKATLSKVQSVDQRMRLECGVGFRQLRTCRRIRPGQLIGVMRDLNRRVERVFDSSRRTPEAGAGSMTKADGYRGIDPDGVAEPRPIISAIARSAERCSTCAT